MRVVRTTDRALFPRAMKRIAMLAWVFDFCTLFQHDRVLVVSALQNTAYTGNNSLILMNEK